MKDERSGIRVLLTAILILSPMPGRFVLAQTAVTAPPGQTLEQGWAWAASVVAEGGHRDVWVAYSIERLMNEDSWIGSIRSSSGGRDTSLLERITGSRIEFNDDLQSPGSAQLAAQQVLRTAESPEPRKVMKEIVFLFRYDGSPSSPSNLITIRTSNLTLAVDLDGVPLLWLGKQDRSTSQSFLVTMFRGAEYTKIQKKLIATIGIHGPGDQVLGFLKRVAESEHDREVRLDAVFWIGQQNSEEALAYLHALATSTVETDIMERAVFGISQIDGESATDALITVGRSGSNEELRKKAVFWLGQRASRKALESLRDFVHSDENEEVQKQAVFALGQIGDGGGIEDLIAIAKMHQNPKIRKQAIFWLGQTDDPRAFDAIVGIAKGR